MSSPFNKVFQRNNPLKQGGYVGGADVKGAYYVPTGKMYADMFAKIGKAVADVDANKQKKKDRKNLSDEAYQIKYGEKKFKNGT